MSDETVRQLLDRFSSGKRDVAWSEFLERYSPLILHVIRRHDADHERATECFNHVCGALSDDGFRRLLSFRPDGPARFKTWLMTHVFDGMAKTWKQVTGATVPPARVAAAALFVPDIGRVVMHGGYTWSDVSPRKDMYSWTGARWEFVEYTTSLNDVPALWNHSMGWDPSGRRLIVTGGFMDSAHAQPNGNTWYVTFSNATGAWQATWTLASLGCQSAAGSPPDPVVHEGARMAYDPAAQVLVSFGGELAGGESSYANTVECR